MRYNSLLDTDSYKSSHFQLFPKDMTYSHFYLEARGGEFPGTIFFGLQYIVEEYLSKGFTLQDVHEAHSFFIKHGLPFNLAGWEKMFERYQVPSKREVITDSGVITGSGRAHFPIRVKAVKEGTLVPTGNVLMTIESTDPEFAWLPGYLETCLMRVWYGTTVATLSYYCKKTIRRYLERTADDPDAEILFKLHDFGSRGVSSRESAGVGGMAHLVNFMGSDTVTGVEFANHYYGCDMAGYSIPASEHSTIISWGAENEANAYENLLNAFCKPGALVACVSDSYNLWKAISDIWGSELKQKIVDSGGTLVVRPDSGDPVTVVLRTLELLEQRFGAFLNKKGYKVLNNVRVIQGDGINRKSLEDILEAVVNAGYSASNIAFGMGGGLLQQVNRDTCKFAMKLSFVEVAGKKYGVSKNPITDAGKKSKEGLLELYRKPNGQFFTANPVTADMTRDVKEKMLEVVLENGKILRKQEFGEVRSLAV